MPAAQRGNGVGASTTFPRRAPKIFCGNGARFGSSFRALTSSLGRQSCRLWMLSDRRSARRVRLQLGHQERGLGLWAMACASA